jgi:type II secretion system protein H
MEYREVKERKPMQSVGNRKYKGFTLLELLVVLILMSLISAFAFPKLYDSISSHELKKSAQDIANTIKLARYKAMVLKKILNLKINIYSNELTLISNSDEKIFLKNISKKSNLKFYSEGIMDYDSRNIIIFFPDGTNTGGKFIIKNKKEDKITITLPNIVGSIKIT